MSNGQVIAVIYGVVIVLLAGPCAWIQLRGRGGAR